MTAFARRSVRGLRGEVVCELRSVNHRYLDIAFKLPDALRALEGQLRDRIRARLVRGRIDAQVRFIDDGGLQTIAINGVLVDALAQAVERLRGQYPFLAPPTALDVLRWPGVIAEPAPDEQPLAAATVAVLDAALDALEQERRREGGALLAVIAERLGTMEAIVAELRPAAAGLSALLRVRLVARLEQLNVTVDADRMAQEVALAAQRADVAEELDRLAAHLAEYRAALAGGEPVGRRLDFLAQEMHREANTLSSKAASTLLSERAVELKVQIEQIREQVQNVE